MLVRTVLCIAVVVTVLIEVCAATRGCPRDRLRQGCRIQDGYCLCGFGCDSDYRYLNRNECISALRGESRDICSRNPCRNSGICTQKSDKPWFSCHCAGSGYYGVRCENQCPSENSINSGGSGTFPFDCIVI